jgi:S-(hydroxymethyl)glutathione dehydrogenase/alcohol dehydrogenase
MRQVGEPLTVEEIELDPPGPGEVLIRMAAAGVCGSDRHILGGHFPAPVPSVCGHEGSGVVAATGPDVDGIEVGDHVIHTFVGSCGRCANCRAGRRTFCDVSPRADGAFADGTFRMHALDGTDIATPLGLGSFSAHTVTPARNCVVVECDVDLVHAALVSCGVSTGVGAVINVAGTEIGDTVVVIGVGGVGAAALLGARVAGAGRIIAVDVHADRRAIAESLGASEYVDASEGHLLEALRAACGSRRADRVVMTVNEVRAEHYGAAIGCLRPGGVAVQVGSSESDLDQVPVNPREFTLRQVYFTGTVYGGMDPARDALRWVALYREGRLPVGELVTATYSLDDINAAFTDLAAGTNIRGVVDFAR